MIYEKAKVDEYYRREKAKEGKKFQLPWMHGAYNLISEHVNDVIKLFYMRTFNVSGAHSGVVMPDGKVNSFYNQNYIGVCTIGDFDTKDVPKDVWDFNLMVCRDIMDKFGFGSGSVLGHREVYDNVGVKREKQCPGVKWDMDAFRKDL